MELFPLMVVFFCTIIPFKSALPVDVRIANIRNDHLAIHLPPAKPTEIDSPSLSSIWKMIPNNVAQNVSFTVDDFRLKVLESIRLLNKTLDNSNVTTSTDESALPKNLTLAETSEEIKGGLTRALQHNETRTRMSRFVNPVLLKLLLDYSSSPRRPFIPPNPTSNGAVSDKTMVDMAVIGSFTLLGLAIIATFPVQQPIFLPPIFFLEATGGGMSHNKELILPPSDSWTSPAISAMNHLTAVRGSTNEEEYDEPSTEPPYQTEIVNDNDDDDYYDTTTQAPLPDLSPQFLQVLVSFVNNEPVKVDVINEGELMANYTYREARV